MLQNEISSIIHCGRQISTQEIREIQETVNLCSRLSRKELAQTVSENLQWHTASGTNKTDACLKLLEKLEAQGILQLPEKRTLSKQITERFIPITDRTAPRTDIVGSLRDLGLIELDIVEDGKNANLWKEYILRYHYLGYKKPFGYYFRYFIKSQCGLLGCVLYSGAAKSIGVRDRWIGWSEGQRLRNLSWVINNSRFLLFPWVKVKNLASHILGQISKRIGYDWQDRWGYSPVLLETFVDPHHYLGTCYNASNWQYLGMTTGQGLVRKGKTYRTTAKKIFVKPLTRDFRKLLCSGRLIGRAQI